MYNERLANMMNKANQVEEITKQLEDQEMRLFDKL
jgi:hypothetical protein